jgi:hypothetical protein
MTISGGCVLSSFSPGMVTWELPQRRLVALARCEGSHHSVAPRRVAERHLFGQEASPAEKTGRKKRPTPTLFDNPTAGDTDGLTTAELKAQPGVTVLDRLHQAMILFGAQRSEMLKRFLVEDGVATAAQ